MLSKFRGILFADSGAKQVATTAKNENTLDFSDGIVAHLFFSGL